MGGTRDTTATPCVNASTLSTAQHVKLESMTGTPALSPPPSSTSTITTDTREDDSIIPTTTTLGNETSGSPSHHRPCLIRRHSSPDLENPFPPDEATGSTAAAAAKKRVSFASLEIRNYDIVIGDHPCCMMGYPISLGWDYTPAKGLSLDQYEAVRAGVRRNRSQLRLTCDERQTILRSSTSEAELRKASRKLHRSRSCVDHSCTKQFFSQAE